uniref:Uncharacterized protein n=1 Tax=Anguilla anguilla TaxID=7936 RepID=A0A0E9T4N6_ANGAN
MNIILFSVSNFLLKSLEPNDNEIRCQRLKMKLS